MDEILEKLQDLEKKYNIKIIYACESGSRVWGFNKDDSDYDIRFIFKYNDKREYISLSEINDVVEENIGNFDFIGWDVKKALKLHYNNNPSLREWLNSNIVYIDCGIDEIFKGLGNFNKNTLKQYYKNIAFKQWKKYCSKKYDKSKNKNYLYVLRCILCWKSLNNHIYPPVNINELIDSVDLSENIKSEISNLVDLTKKDKKINDSSLDKICKFIKDYFLNMKNSADKIVNDKVFIKYDKRFKEIIC